MQKERLLLEADGRHWIEARADRFDAPRSSGTAALLAVPHRPKLVLPEHWLHGLSERSDLEAYVLDPGYLERILLGHFKTLGQNEDFVWSLLHGEPSALARLNEVLGVLQPKSRVVGVVRPALILPSRACGQQSLLRPGKITESALGYDKIERPASDVSALSLSATPFATAPDCSSFVLTTPSTVFLPRDSEVLSQSARAAAPQRYQGNLRGGRRIKRLASGLAAVWVALVLPPRTIDHGNRIRVITADEPIAKAPWLTRVTAAASHILTVPQPARGKMHQTIVLARELPVIVLKVPGSNSGAFASLALLRASQRQVQGPQRQIPTEAWPVAPTISVRAEAALVTQQTILPRDTERVPSSRHATKKKRQIVSGSPLRNSPDVATLVLPDVLRPQ